MKKNTSRGGLYLASLAIFAIASLTIAGPMAAGAASDRIGASRLGELLVLDGLFDGNNKNGHGDVSRLGELIVLDGLFDSDDSNEDDRKSKGKISRLGELLVLDSLFNGGDRTVTVQRGDTLSGIAERELGDASRFPEIARLNNIENPNLIVTGQVLRIPRDGGVGASRLGELIVLDGLFSH